MSILNEILSELMQVENDIGKFHVILKTLKVYYEAEYNEEISAIIWLVEQQFKNSEQKLADTITKLDEYLLNNK